MAKITVKIPLAELIAAKPREVEAVIARHLSEGGIPCHLGLTGMHFDRPGVLTRPQQIGDAFATYVWEDR